MLFWEDNERKRIPMKTKRQVYERAGGKCEKCGESLLMRNGDFHHTRDPTVIPRASSIRFLCPTCHRRFGHKRRTKETETLFGVEKESKIVRKKVVPIKKSDKKKPNTKRKAIRDIFGNVMGYKTVKVRETIKTNKSTTRKPKKKNTTIATKTKRKKSSDDYFL